MTRQLKHDPSVFDEIASLSSAEQREHFYRRMAHLGSNDEIVQIAEAMGFLAVLTRQTPSEIAAERLKFEILLHDAVASLMTANDTAFAYQCDIDQRLKDLPTDTAGDLDPKHLAALLSETPRQYFEQTEIPAVSGSIAEHAERLRHTSQQFGTSVATSTDPQHGAFVQIGRALTAMANLDNASNHLRALTTPLLATSPRPRYPLLGVPARGSSLEFTLGNESSSTTDDIANRHPVNRKSCAQHCPH